jgi:hypothetical protein
MGDQRNFLFLGANSSKNYALANDGSTIGVQIPLRGSEFDFFVELPTRCSKRRCNVMKLLKKSLRMIAPFLMFALLAGSGFSPRGGAFANSQFVGLEDPSKHITVTVWLKQRNKAAFDELVRKMYQPGAPQYHHFLTHEQYLNQFAPSPADVAQEQEYLTAHNLAVISVDTYNHYVVAEGRVSDAQTAFNVQLSRVNLKGHIHRVGNAQLPSRGR